MKKAIISSLLMILVVLGMAGSHVEAERSIPDRPTNATVLDPKHYLSQETIAKINQENATWQSTKEQLQVGVYLTDHLPMDLESFSNQLFRKWQVGYSGTNNGTLLVIAIEDRQFRIETSDRASTVLPDVRVKRILDQSKDFFRNEDYDNGVLYIVDAMGDAFYGTERSQKRLSEFQENQEQASDGLDIGAIIVIVIVVLILIKGGRGGRGGGGLGSLLWLLASSSSSSYSGRSGRGSGSFGSGGGGWSGGGGGGGGASSGW